MAPRLRPQVLPDPMHPRAELFANAYVPPGSVIGRESSSSLRVSDQDQRVTPPHRIASSPLCRITFSNARTGPFASRVPRSNCETNPTDTFR